VPLTPADVRTLFRVPSGWRGRLRDFDPGWDARDHVKGRKRARKARAESFLSENLETLRAAQEVLWATDGHAVLVVLQAMDGAGKDGTIKHVMSGVNPQGCQVFGFKKPTPEELDHTFLWRFMKRLPERGRIGIFNRSYYEDVLVVRVHPELVETQQRARGKRGRGFWEERFDDINRFERHLTRNGTLVVKFFLHMSKGEQRRRFLARLDDPAKRWKFSDADLDEREHWNAYQHAFEDMLRHTSTRWAPWWVIPADHKWIARALVAGILTRTIQSLGLQMPEVPPERELELEAAKRRLSAGSA
jgi:PPK2 family polyphosphate:nucleotide phosphotransferase